MKHLPIIAFAAITMMSCNAKQTLAIGSGEEDSICVKDTVVQIDEKNEFMLKIKTYADKKLFKVRYGDNHLFYHTNEISVDWPETIMGFDGKTLQTALRKLSDIDEEDVSKFVEKWAMETMPDAMDGSAELTTEHDEKADYERDDSDNSDGIMYDTDCTKRVKFVDVDSIRNIITFEKYSCDNMGCGLGSCIYYFYDYMLYDYANNKVLTKEDLIADEKKAVEQLKDQCIGENEYGGLEGLASIETLPETFFINNDVMMWCFGKYEISFGADGCPQLGFDVKECPEVLTEYGKKIFGITK